MFLLIANSNLPLQIALMFIQQYFSYIVVISSIGR